MNYPAFYKSAPIASVDEATHSVVGVACSEAQDAEGEICAYDKQKEQYRVWSDSAIAATSAWAKRVARGNVRVQHDPKRLGGVVTDLQFRDGPREVWLTTEVLPDVWPLVESAVLTSYSQAGTYLRRWHKACGTEIARGNDCPTCSMRDVPIHYFARLAEVSLCDKGSNPDATIRFVKACGAIEMRKARGGGPANAATGSWHQDPWDDSWIFVPPTILPDDTTGFEGFSLAGGLKPYIVPAHAMGSMNTAMFNPNDDSTGLE